MTTATHTVTACHIFADTPTGRDQFTYLVYGPYPTGTYDVEIHRGHIQYNEDLADTYITTVGDLPRNTHLCADMWPTMSFIASNS